MGPRLRGDDGSLVAKDGLLVCANQQPHFCLPLQCANDAEEVLGVWISSRRQHAVQALAGFFDLERELLESNRRIDEVTQHRLSRCNVAGKVGVDRLCEQRLAELWIALRPRQDRLLEISSECHSPCLHPFRNERFAALQATQASIAIWTIVTNTLLCSTQNMTRASRNIVRWEIVHVS
jgi:hypothetical protein